MVTVRGSAVPSRTPFSQAKRSSEPTSPRFSVTSSSLWVLGTLRTVLKRSLPLRYSEYFTS